MKIRDSLFLFIPKSKKKKNLGFPHSKFEQLRSKNKIIIKERQQLSCNEASHPITKQGVRKMFSKKHSKVMKDIFCRFGKIQQSGSFPAMQRARFTPKCQKAPLFIWFGIMNVCNDYIKLSRKG